MIGDGWWCAGLFVIVPPVVVNGRLAAPCASSSLAACNDSKAVRNSSLACCGCALLLVIGGCLSCSSFYFHWLPRLLSLFFNFGCLFFFLCCVASSSLCGCIRIVFVGCVDASLTTQVSSSPYGCAPLLKKFIGSLLVIGEKRSPTWADCYIGLVRLV
ncbi:hypothetical protein Droror1_Dr00015692 [Drosera rotundifolia]